jgi:hypothetical protein
MVDRSDQRRHTGGEPEGSTAEDAEAGERATDEGMPEHPDDATAEALGQPSGTGRGPIPPTDAGPRGPVTADDPEDGDGGYDLGGEG